MRAHLAHIPTIDNRFRRWLALAVVLLLAYWLLRTLRLDLYPVFLDEANHIWWARLVWRWQPFHAASDGRLLNIWWMALFWPFNEAVWLSRVAHLLGTVVGIAGGLALAREVYDQSTAVMAAVLLIFAPLLVFFDRMALADTLSTPTVVLALLFAVRAVRQPARWWWPVLSGMMLTAAISAKLSNVVFLGIPLALAVTYWGRYPWARLVRAALAIWSACVWTLIPLAAGLKFVGGSDLGLDLLTRKTDTSALGWLGYAPASGPALWGNVAAMMSGALVVVLVALLLVALLEGRRGSWFLGLTLAATLGVLVVRTQPEFIETRFLPVYVPLLVLPAARGLWLAGQQLPGRWRALALITAMVGLSAPGLDLTADLYADPAQASLGAWDRSQYVAYWPSGYGFQEVLAAAALVEGPVDVVVMDLGSWQRLAAYVPVDPLTVYQPDESQRVAGLYLRYIDAARLGGRADWLTPDVTTWLVVDEPLQTATALALPVALTPVQVFERPGDESFLGVYAVSLPADGP